MALLKHHQLVPSGKGSSWGFVRDSHRIRGALDFQKVDLGPQQLLSLQSAAVSLALRAAIKEVQAAVERVEGKLDDVLSLLRAERVGNMLGTRRALEPLVVRVRTDDEISSTDWSSAGSLGADIARDMEALRIHIRSKLDTASGGWRPGERAKNAEALFERKGLLVESIALLVVAEYNLGAWHELRIADVRANEPEHLAWTIEDAEAALASETDDDQMIADALRAVADELTTPHSYDGLAPWQLPELTHARLKLDELAAWFADQRVLDLAPLGEARYPTAKESVRDLTRNVGAIAARSVDVVRDRLRRGGDDPSAPPIDASPKP